MEQQQSPKELKSQCPGKRGALVWLLFILLFGWGTPSTLWAATSAPKLEELEGEDLKEKEAKPKNPKASKKTTKKKKRSLWQRFTDGAGKLVPGPVKRSWKRTKKRWRKMVKVYRAVKSLVGESDKERKVRLKKEKKQAVKNKWLAQDRQIEQRIRKRLRLTLLEQSCVAGSASSCLKWSRLRPKAARPKHHLRDIWMRRKQWKKLLPLCGKLHKKSSTHFRDHLCYVQTLVALKRRKKAAKVFRKLVKKYPRRGAAWLYYGRYLLKRKVYRNAQIACKNATKLMPKEPTAWYCLGQAWGKKAKKPARQAFYQACKLKMSKGCSAVLKLRPKGMRGFYWWTTTVSRLSAQSVSGGTLRQSCRFGLGAACRRLSVHYRAKARRFVKYKRGELAAWWYRRATRYAPNSPEAWKDLGAFLVKRRLWLEASLALKRSLYLKNRQPKLWDLLGKCNKKLAQVALEKSNHAYRRACALGQHRACHYIGFATD